MADALRSQQLTRQQPQVETVQARLDLKIRQAKADTEALQRELVAMAELEKQNQILGAERERITPIMISGNIKSMEEGTTLTGSVRRCRQN